jgi:hypothetical protein
MPFDLSWVPKELWSTSPFVALVLVYVIVKWGPQARLRKASREVIDETALQVGAMYAALVKPSREGGRSVVGQVEDIHRWIAAPGPDDTQVSRLGTLDGRLTNILDKQMSLLERMQEGQEALHEEVKLLKAAVLPPLPIRRSTTVPRGRNREEEG